MQITDKDITPGNAAAMREALRRISHQLWDWVDPGCNDDCCAPKRELARIADAALAAPTRNCDICRTKREAKMEYDSRHDVEYGSKDDFVDWLFRPAEGGAE